jgi:hypothetical protein
MPTQIYATVPRTDTTLLIDTPDWLLVLLTKETSGVVEVGTKQDLNPAGSGKGVALPVDVQISFLLEPASQLYMVAQDNNQRVGIISLVPPDIEKLQLMRSMNAALLRLAPSPDTSGGLGVYLGEDMPGYVKMPKPIDGGPLAVGDVTGEGVDMSGYYAALNGGARTTRGRR